MMLPWGGDLPEEALPFFSPSAIWTRLPNDAEGTAALASTVCEGALFDYLDVFLDLCLRATQVPSPTTPGARSAPVGDAAQRQKAYSRYRIEKDPARGMLTRMHGPEFTEKLITEVLFDYEKSESRSKSASGSGVVASSGRV
jgi:phycoerythrobilin:ferredoxin oxidoreductase